MYSIKNKKTKMMNTYDNIHGTPIHPMRSGWTVIELIFIIIVIGILATIAIGKLSGSRDDAKLSANVANMTICITDAAAFYTATGKDFTEEDHSYACDENNTKCFDIIYSVNGKDFNVTTNSTRESYCEDIENVGGHLAKSYDFGGRGIKR